MDIDENMKKFKQDLNNKNLSNEYIIRKYLCNGSSPVLEDEIIFEIKNQIAEKFKIHPNEVIIVGSGKLGFSIAPQKRFKHFNVDSDVDVAIISEKLFDDFWLELLSFNINTTSRTEKEENLYNEFRKYFFKGWLRPDKFPFRYEGKQEWFSFF